MTYPNSLDKKGYMQSKVGEDYLGLVFDYRYCLDVKSLDTKAGVCQEEAFVAEDGLTLSPAVIMN